MEPIASDPVLRGVDAAMERLVLFDLLTPEVASCLDALRKELIDDVAG